METTLSATDTSHAAPVRGPKRPDGIPMQNVPEIFTVDTGGSKKPQPLIKRKVALDVLQGLPPPRIAALDGVRFARMDQPPDILQLDRPRSRGGRKRSRSSSSSSSSSSEAEQEQEEQMDCKTRIIAALKFMATNVILLIIVVAYVVGGTAMFQQLEQDNERVACATVRAGYVSVLNTTNLKLYAISEAGLTEDATLSNFESVLNDFATQVISLGAYSINANCSTIGLDSSNPSVWNFPNAMLFCMTIVSTIGYGQITPKTSMGRIAVICYGAIGIPLMLIFLANIGNLMSEYFKKLYSNVCCCKWCDSVKTVPKKKKKRAEEKSVTSRPSTALGADNPAFETSSAINRDPLNGMGDHPLRPLTAQFVRPRTARPSDEILSESTRPGTAKSGMSGMSEGNGSASGSEEEEEEVLEPGIPTVVGLALIAAYVFAGSLIFSGIQDWDTVTSAYFCFVTLTTIGFGDFYPGYNMDMGKDYVQSYMAASSIYIILGMASISMCLNLLSEEMTMKVAWLIKVIKCKKCRKKPEAENKIPEVITDRPRTASNNAEDPFPNDTQELILDRPLSARSARISSRPGSAASMRGGAPPEKNVSVA